MFVVYDTSLERVGIIENFFSCQWLEHYKKPGECKIEAAITPENRDVIRDGYRIYNTDSDQVAKMARIEEIEDAIICRAMMTSDLLKDRVVMATRNITNVEQGMRSAYTANQRDLPLTLGPSQGFTDVHETEVTWGSVLECWEKLAESSTLGFKSIWDPHTESETLVIYKGVDRSYGALYNGYFGVDANNILNVRYIEDSNALKNVAVVAGEGEGAARVVRTVSLVPNLTGENRRELFVDARDLQKTRSEATYTGMDSEGNPTWSYTNLTYSTSQYNAMLDARGREKLMENIAEMSIDCEVLQQTILLGRDYNLGDRVPIKLPEWGVYASAVAGSTLRVYEGDSPIVSVTLDKFEVINL